VVFFRNFGWESFFGLFLSKFLMKMFWRRGSLVLIWDYLLFVDGETWGGGFLG
jgi:hypothetical protein